MRSVSNSVWKVGVSPFMLESIHTNFQHVSIQELIFLSENVNFLIADGVKFAHPLHHLGKKKEDLPLIAIDR